MLLDSPLADFCHFSPHCIRSLIYDVKVCPVAGILETRLLVVYVIYSLISIFWHLMVCESDVCLIA